MTTQQRVPAGVSTGGQFTHGTRAPAQIALEPTTVDGHTAEEHRQWARDSARQAAESFERCDTDGFLSQWASGLTADLHRAKARIADAGGTSSFPALFDMDGNLVAAKLVDTRYRRSWMLLGDDDPNGRAAGWFNPSKHSDPERRRANNAAKGFFVGKVAAPADAKLTSPPGARGLGGATSVSVSVYRTDRGFSRDVTVLDNGIEQHPAMVLDSVIGSRVAVTAGRDGLARLEQCLTDAQAAGDRLRVRSLKRQLGRVRVEHEHARDELARRESRLKDLLLDDIADPGRRTAAWERVVAQHPITQQTAADSLAWVARVDGSRGRQRAVGGSTGTRNSGRSL